MGNKLSFSVAAILVSAVMVPSFGAFATNVGSLESTMSECTLQLEDSRYALDKAHSSAVITIQPDEIGVFGYGSLLNLQSLGRTLENPYTGQVTPARLSGWVRSWSALYPNNNRYLVNSADRLAPKDILYLNVEPNASSTINGAIVVIKKSELHRLDQRELTYYREDVTEQVRGAVIRGGRVVTYVAKPEYTAKPGMTFPEVGQRSTYIDLMEKAFEHYDPEFRHEYNATTLAPPPGLVFDDILND